MKQGKAKSALVPVDISDGCSTVVLKMDGLDWICLGGVIYRIRC